MPEINPAASFLVATSWQALKRAEFEDEATMMTNCTVIILFAGFFIEANLNHIIDTMGKAADVSTFAGGGNPGLGTKLAWFYGSFISHRDLTDKEGVYKAMWQDYPEIKEIIDFRNTISHGKMNNQLANLRDAKRLRASAKKLVDRLLTASEQAGHPFERRVTYKMSIGLGD